MFQKEILNEATLFFKEKQAVSQDENILSNENELMDIDTTSQTLQPSNIIDNVYAKSAILEVELSSSEMQAAVGKNYGKLQFAFNSFRINLKKTCQQQKCLLN